MNKPNQLQAGDHITEAVRLVRPLAEGGMGRVWIAEHLGLHTDVVVKLMAPEMAVRADGAERFAREAAVAAAIKSPHVVQVFDHGVTKATTDEGTPYIVMELLEGKDLGAHLAEKGRMAPNDVVTLVVQIGKALTKAHRAGIVHRDIKPDNIFLCDTDGGELFVKLLDFGTARREEQASSRTTVPGQIMGTPYYMSPEQSIGSTEIDERSDIWSLGVVVFEALTGRKPFDGASIGAITIAIHGALPMPTDLSPELPPAVDLWFARACAPLPADRFASVREATSALAVAITGVDTVDVSTEAVFFPVHAHAGASATRQSTPLRPVSRPIEPLIASLPARGSERKATTVLAAIVMGVAAVAMVTIVAGRSGGGAESAASSAPTTHAAELAPPSPSPSPPAVETAEAKMQEPVPAPVAEAKPTAAPILPSRAGKRAAKATPAPVVAEPAAHGAKAAKAPAPARGARSTPKEPKEKENADDDLVRLTKAAAQHGDPASAAPPSAAHPATAPPVTPSPVAPTAPAPSLATPPPLPSDP